MSNALQNPLNFTARLLMVALFLPAGIGKLTGFAGTVGYISSVGLPLPTLAAAAALCLAGLFGSAYYNIWLTRTDLSVNIGATSALTLLVIVISAACNMLRH